MTTVIETQRRKLSKLFWRTDRLVYRATTLVRCWMKWRFAPEILQRAMGVVQHGVEQPQSVVPWVVVAQVQLSQEARVQSWCQKSTAFFTDPTEGQTGPQQDVCKTYLLDTAWPFHWVSRAEVHLSNSSVQKGLVSPWESCFTPKSPRLLSVRSNVFSPEDFELRTVVSDMQLFAVKLQFFNLEKTISHVSKLVFPLYRQINCMPCHLSFGVTVSITAVVLNTRTQKQWCADLSVSSLHFCSPSESCITPSSVSLFSLRSNSLRWDELMQEAKSLQHFAVR